VRTACQRQLDDGSGTHNAVGFIFPNKAEHISIGIALNAPHKPRAGLRFGGHPKDNGNQ